VTVLVPGYEPEKVSQCVEGKTLIIGGVDAEPKEFPHMVSNSKHFAVMATLKCSIKKYVVQIPARLSLILT
jgi:hypothetical protein